MQNTMLDNWPSYFIKIAELVSTRSSCCKRQVGAVITTPDKRIIATGYNGTPSGMTNCNEGGCPRCNSNTPSGEKLSDCLCCHAEENAIVQCAKLGISTEGNFLYCTLSPCLNCSKLIINAGITHVFYSKLYPSKKAKFHLEFLSKKCKVEQVNYH